MRYFVRKLIVRTLFANCGSEKNVQAQKIQEAEERMAQANAKIVEAERKADIDRQQIPEYASTSQIGEFFNVRTCSKLRLLDEYASFPCFTR